NPDPLTSGSAEQPVNGRAQSLTEDIPESDFDCADRAVENWSAAPARIPEHPLPEQLNLGRVLADKETLVLHYCLSQSSFFACDRSFTQADQSLIGSDFAEYPVDAADINDDGFQSCDFQVQAFGLSSGVLCGIGEGCQAR